MKEAWMYGDTDADDFVILGIERETDPQQLDYVRDFIGLPSKQLTAGSMVREIVRAARIAVTNAQRALVDKRKEETRKYLEQKRIASEEEIALKTEKARERYLARLIKRRESARDESDDRRNVLRVLYSMQNNVELSQ